MIAIITALADENMSIVVALATSLAKVPGLFIGLVS